MGAWGGGLYDGDFALDLEETIKGLLRAPLSDDDVLGELQSSLGSSGGADGLDYWLVLADQLERQGVPRRDVFDRAIAIVETGQDVAMLEELGAEPTTLAERRRETTKLRDPRPAKPRKIVKKPQPLLRERGDALTWPTDAGDTINPYVREDQLWKLGGFTQDGWGFGIVTDAGHRFHVSRSPRCSR